MGQRKPHLSQMERAARNKQIRKRRADGLTYRELSEEFGICLEQIARIVKQNPPAMGGLDVKWERVRELRKTLSAKQIAKELHISLAAVYRSLNHQNGRAKHE